MLLHYIVPAEPAHNREDITMNRLKSIFISLFLSMLLASIGAATWNILRGPDNHAWWGVLIAAIVPVTFFLRLMVVPTARTSRHLAWMPLAGLLGALIAASGGERGLLLSIALVVGTVLPLIYIYWYSRFDSRTPGALAAGRLLPDFPLDDLDGRSLRSAELVAKPALWIFFRDNWCPLCMAQIREIAEQYRELAARGVEVHLISPQPQGHSRDLSLRFDAPMRFLTDRDNRAASVLGILARGGLPMGMQVLGYESDVPMPTVVITAAGGRIVYSDLTENYRIRPEPTDFIAALDRAGL